MSDETESDRFASKVAELTDNYWGRNARAFLASVVGKHLRREFPNFSQIAPNGLKRFLELKPVVHTVQHPSIKAKIGYIPLSVPVPDDTSALFHDIDDTTRAREDTQTASGLSDVFWRAFYRPLRGPRYVIIDAVTNTFRVSGNVSNKSVNETAYEIRRDDLSYPPAEADQQTLVMSNKDAIRKWLQAHGLDERLFQKECHRENEIYQHKAIFRVTPDPNSSAPITAGAHKLAQSLARLEEKDLHRINIPLDLVMKML